MKPSKGSELILCALLAAATTTGMPRRALADAPYPYCNNGGGGALALRQMGSDADALLFLTQTPGAEDLVFLDPDDPTTEVGRCCPERAQTMISASYNGVFECNGTDTLFVLNGTVGGGRVLELELNAFTEPIVGASCGEPGATDESACASSAYTCRELRRICIPGLSEDFQASHVAVIDPPGAQGPWLVVTVGPGPGNLVFADPTRPSCATSCPDPVESVGSCRISYGGFPVTVGSMTGAGGRELLVGDAQLDLIHRVRVNGRSGDLSCEIVDTEPAPGGGVLNGLTIDTERHRRFAAEDVTATIYDDPTFGCGALGATRGPRDGAAALALLLLAGVVRRAARPARTRSVA